MFEFEYLNAFSTETVQESLGLFYNSSEKPKILEIFTPSNENSDILNQYFKFIQ
jgi:2-succinyl-5-enolpyruvyl-6-hydroxy-3-cyclohexene-1-carboxylate synthase